MIIDLLRDAENTQHPVRIDRRRGLWQMGSIYGFVVSMSDRRGSSVEVLAEPWRPR